MWFQFDEPYATAIVLPSSGVMAVFCPGDTRPGPNRLYSALMGNGLDPSGRGIAGASVEARNQEMAVSRSTSSGTFTIDFKPNAGTRICAPMPLPGAAKVMAATAT